MSEPLPAAPAGYQADRILSERTGSWVRLARTPTGAWGCLKLQRAAHPAALAELTAVRERLFPLTGTEGFMPLRAWGVDHPAGVLWEEMSLADNLMTGGDFDPDQHESYTPLNLVLWLSEHGPASTRQVIAWGRRLATALTELHSARLFHRDVKPANLLCWRGQPVLADYGSVGREGSPIEFPGTEGYVPPDGLGSPALDVFALGRTLYELWTGLDRFQFPSLPPALTESADWNTHGWWLNEVLLQAAEGRPSRRFGTAGQFQAALAAAARGRRRISRRTFIGSAATIAGIAATAYVWRNLPSHRAVWRRLATGRFGYENWQGHELTCDWPQRRVYSLAHGNRLGLHWQSYDLRTGEHRERNWPQGPEIYRHLRHPELGDLWGISARTGSIVRVALDGSEVTPLAVPPLNDTRFTGPAYWNPFRRRIGAFNGYGNFTNELTRREFDHGRLAWERIPETGPQPWPRANALLFPGPGMKTWFLYGGNGNSSGEEGRREAGLKDFAGDYHPLRDLWELDLATNQWRQWWRVQQWRPPPLKAAIHHPGLNAVAFLAGSEPGLPQAGALNLWRRATDPLPRRLPSAGDPPPLFRCWTLLVDPDTQDLLVFADEGVFAVALQPA